MFLFSLGRHTSGWTRRRTAWWWWPPPREGTFLTADWRTFLVEIAPPSTATRTTTRTPGLQLTWASGSSRRRTLWDTPGRKISTRFCFLVPHRLSALVADGLLLLLQRLRTLGAQELGFSGVQRRSELVHSLQPHRRWQSQWTGVQFLFALLHSNNWCETEGRLKRADDWVEKCCFI